jgi:hypothetical protein
MSGSISQAAYFEGTLSVGDGLEIDGDLVATAAWDDPSTTLSWIVTDEDPNAPWGYPWKYTYTLEVPVKEISHFIVEVSSGELPVTDEDISGVEGLVEMTIGDNLPTDDEGANPRMPSAVYGAKFDVTQEATVVTVMFYCNRDPVWGDFYAKDGTVTVAGEKTPVALWNAGFSETDDDPEDLPSSGSVEDHVLVPDTDIWVPEPGSLALLLAGSLSILVLRRRK